MRNTKQVLQNTQSLPRGTKTDLWNRKTLPMKYAKCFQKYEDAIAANIANPPHQDRIISLTPY